MRSGPSGGAAQPSRSGIEEASPPAVGSHLVVLGACLFILTAALFLTPPSGPDGSVQIGPYPLPGICAFNNLTALPCPGCGLTRSLVSAVRADFSASLVHHRLGLLTLVYLLLQLLFRAGAVLSPSRWRSLFPSERGLNLGLAVLGVLFLVNWIAVLAGF